MKARKIRIGSRRSALAVAQSKMVMEAIQSTHPHLELELVTMSTAGDVNMRPFSEAGDPFGIKGLFTRELEEALLRSELDLVIHSLKDLPVRQDPRLPLVAYFKRGDPRDALVLSRSEPEGPIGCSSARRRLQLAALFPERPVEPIRGNVLTRLDKLDEGQFATLVLAAAGLQRLGLEARIDRYFSPEEIVPAAGQGILACQGREGEDYGFLSSIRDRDAEDCARAERGFVAALNGGCSSPVAAYAELCGEELTLLGFYADEATGAFQKGRLSGNRKEAEQWGAELALSLKERAQP